VVAIIAVILAFNCRDHRLKSCCWYASSRSSSDLASKISVICLAGRLNVFLTVRRIDENPSDMVRKHRKRYVDWPRLDDERGVIGK
jgi:hypothetical protein